MQTLECTVTENNIHSTDIVKLYYIIYSIENYHDFEILF
jgi:hypothetical protein